jgi:dienelactone hydrolase
MRFVCALAVLAWATTAVAQDVTSRDIKFFSEGIQCYARLYLPKNFKPDTRAPGVVLAPGWMQTEASIDKYAARFASRGLVAMAIDYRGWGHSGGYVYLADTIRVDDRQRFSQHTAKVKIRRRRLLPFDQVLDIRNAVAYLQGEPGVDPARVGIWGTDTAGGHVVVAAATDARVTVAVAQVPIIEGKDVPRQATPRSPELHAAELRRARSAAAPPAATPAGTEAETRLALADYHPFWFADQIAETTAILFVIAEHDARVKNDTNAIAASRAMKGPTGVTVVNGATHGLGTAGAFETAADAAAAWFLKYL